MKRLFLLSVALTATAVAFGLGKEYDIRPEAAKLTDAPIAVEWEAALRPGLAAALDDRVIATYANDAKAARALLDMLRGAYVTDPLSLKTIAAVTQLVMRPGGDPLSRRNWSNLLLEKGWKTEDAYVRVFCLDQLRWCGAADQAEQVLRIAAKAGDANVTETANLVVRELKAHDTMPKDFKVPCEEGFVPLFNGVSLDGWIGARDAYAVLEPGVLTCTPVAPFGGNLLTAKEYENFVLRFDFKLTAGANNGVGIRCCEVGDAAYSAIELQILDDTDPQYAKLRKEQYHGSIYGVVASAKKEDGSSYLKPVGEWNTEEVVADGTHIKVTLNGTVIVDADTAAFDPDPKAREVKDGREHYGLLNRKGHIGWLGHGAVVSWRNVRIKELPGCGKALRGTDRLGIVIDSLQKPVREASDRTYRYGAAFADISAKDFQPGDSADEKDARRVKENHEWLERRTARGEWRVCAVHLDPAAVDAAIALAVKCGAPYVTVSASAPDAPEYKKRCEAKGLLLLLENGEESAEALASRTKELNCGVAFDPANLILHAKGDPVAAVKVLSPYIRHVRLRDAVSPKASGAAGEEVPWGEGELKAEDLFAALDAAGYKGVFAFARLSGDQRVRDLQKAVNWYHSH